MRWSEGDCTESLILPVFCFWWRGCPVHLHPFGELMLSASKTDSKTLTDPVLPLEGAHQTMQIFGYIAYLHLFTSVWVAKAQSTMFFVYFFKGYFLGVHDWAVWTPTPHVKFWQDVVEVFSPSMEWLGLRGKTRKRVQAKRYRFWDGCELCGSERQRKEVQGTFPSWHSFGFQRSPRWRNPAFPSNPVDLFEVIHALFLNITS